MYYDCVRVRVQPSGSQTWVSGVGASATENSSLCLEQGILTKCHCQGRGRACLCLLFGKERAATLQDYNNKKVLLTWRVKIRLLKFCDLILWVCVCAFLFVVCICECSQCLVSSLQFMQIRLWFEKNGLIKTSTNCKGDDNMHVIDMN